MPPIHIVWDLDDDPDGNLRHVAEHGIEKTEVEEVIFGSLSNTAVSKSSGHRITFGYTDDGRYQAVVWEHVQDDPLTVYPVTAYDAREPRRKRR